MLELPPAAPAAAFDSSRVDQLSDAELDGLPFGVICLDPDGTILRYNLYESRLARLDRNQVLGRSFFRDVAPCTSSDAFQGRFRRAAAAADGTPPERFDFLFDFRFGAQRVAVEIVRVPSAPRLYLLINRRELLAARPGLPEGFYAALQRQLAPAEAQAGVRRDALEQRFVEVPWSLLAALRATCDRLAPESWQLFCHEWGVQWGRRLAIDLESAALESRGAALAELPMREVAGRIVEALARQGWGRLSFDFGAARDGVIVAELARSALAESAPGSRSSLVGSSAAPPPMACHLLAGCLGALLTSVAGRRLVVREVECQATAAPRCAFVVVAAPRRAALDAALAAGARGLEAVRLALRRAPATGATRDDL